MKALDINKLINAWEVKESQNRFFVIYRTFFLEKLLLLAISLKYTRPPLVFIIVFWLHFGISTH